MITKDEQWQQLCDEHKKALNLNLQSIATVNAKFSGITNGAITESELDLYDAREQALLEVKQRMKAFIKENV
jgi:hypothetical protein